MHLKEQKGISSKYICHGCIGEKFLSNEVIQTGSKARCGYCEEFEQSWTIEDFADRIEKAFEAHYVRTSNQPDSWQERMQADRESDYVWFRAGYPVLDAIEGAAEIPRTAAEEVLELLADRHGDFDSSAMGEESEFDHESYYEMKGTSSGGWQFEWRQFEHTLLTEARFFSRSAVAHLSLVFGGIEQLKARNNRRLVVQAGPKRSINHLYRARVFQSDEQLEAALCRPDRHIGPPPARHASAGRMNARGISVFYGATEARVAIAEVRPPVGSKVVVAKFELNRSLQLLDLNALEQAIDGGSIFDPTLKNRLERVAFLRSLGQRMTRPVMPDDEALDYLATQAVADFLATENTPIFDGIIYRSVQVKDGRNVVLFHHAARVEAMELPKGTEIEARSYQDTEDGPEIDYWVNEMVPAQEASSVADKRELLCRVSWSETRESGEFDARTTTLSVNSSSVEVHWIDWVNFGSTKYGVTRHRHEQQR